MDQHSLNQIRLLHPIAMADAFEAWNEVQASMPDGIAVIVAESYRSFQRSSELYRLGRTLVNPDGRSGEKPMGHIVTWAQAGESWHNWGLAFDMEMTSNGHPDWTVGPHWLKAVSIMKAHGWEWGGDFTGGKTDNPHFEKKYGHTLKGLMALHNAGKFIPGTTYVQI